MTNERGKFDLDKVIVIVGPTASGKTKLSIDIAEKFNGEVVSADSMQIYREVEIATAKPSEEEMKNVRHHLINIRGIEEEFSVFDYVSLAKKSISEIINKDKIPIICGGTGLYIDSLLNNIEFQKNDRDEELRKSLLDKAKSEGTEVLIEELRKFDPESAERIHPNNLNRIIRAIEIYKTSGMTMTEQIENSRKNGFIYDYLMIGLGFRDREKLYDRINLRVDKMMESGLVEEARYVNEHDASKTLLNAIGYKEVFPYILGNAKIEDCIEKIKMETRRYAKRQLTWFRREKNIHWIFIDDYENFDQINDVASRMIDNFYVGGE